MLVYRLYSVINIKMSLRAIDGARTRGLDLGKVARYQLRHYRICRTNSTDLIIIHDFTYFVNVIFVFFMYKICCFLLITKAGDGNRTHVSSLEGWCSTIELHPQSAQNRNRTSDTRIFSPLLYRLSYLGIDTSSMTSCILQYFRQCVKFIFIYL